MNIDEMQAGRPLDALIAEKVMGWIEVVDAYDETWGMPPERTRRLIKVPEYSTDLAAAWDIITRMNDIAFVLARSLVDNEFWCARFGHHEDGRLIGTMTRGTASTPALAICRAALKLMEGK